MGREISLIAFLDEVVSRNTQHYKKDFELDAQKLRDALNSPYMDEWIFYFMSRPNGTWCVLERDAFLRDSDGYKIWTHYADMPDGIEAYNGLTFERFVWAVIKSQILCAGPRVFRSENLYCKILNEKEKNIYD